MINLTVLKSTAFGLWFLFCWNDNGFHEISCWPSTLSVNIRAEFRILAESTRALFTLKAEITVTNETQRHVDKCVFTDTCDVNCMYSCSFGPSNVGSEKTRKVDRGAVSKPVSLLSTQFSRPRPGPSRVMMSMRGSVLTLLVYTVVPTAPWFLESVCFTYASVKGRLFL